MGVWDGNTEGLDCFDSTPDLPDKEKYFGNEVYAAAKAGKLDEAFGSGTAAVISPMGELNRDGDIIIINDGKIGPLSQKLYDTLTDIQWGRAEDKFGWTVKV